MVYNTKPSMYDLDYIFNNLLPKSLRNYEKRDEQLQMANEVMKALDTCDTLVVEAGTGLGKSLAYLIPAILWLGKDRKIIISTYTKTLQNQLLKSDIPIAKSVLGSTVVANLAFGSENYLCKRRFMRILSEGSYLPFQKDEVQELILWQRGSRTGLRSEAEKKSKISIWADICRGQNTCIGKKCTQRNACYFEYARRKLYSSQIIVTNHHLFFANLSFGGRILPGYSAVIFDEAHNLEEIATSYFGFSITNYTFSYLFRELKRKRIKEIETLLVEVDKAAGDFFQEIAERFPASVTRINKPLDIKPDRLLQLIQLLSKKTARIPPENDEEEAEFKNYNERITELKNSIRSFTNIYDTSYVYWIEKEDKRIALNTAPVDVSEALSASVFDGKVPLVLCSATMTTGPDNFFFFKERLGILRSKEISISSPFDYRNNSILYIPEDEEDPGSLNYPYYITEETRKLIKITKGRAFILFTSYKLMEDVYRLLVSRLPEYNFLKQGDISRDAMLERFTEEERTALLGVSTFWQGVDIPGNALVSVIITKLPFNVPTEPIEEARIETLIQNGINPFLSYQLPKAILILRQGFGRLIRNKTDYGLIAILDTRIRKKSYGRHFLSALPETTLVSNIEDVKDFFNKKEPKTYAQKIQKKHGSLT